MSNPKGTKFASSVLPLFKRYYPDAERAPLWGARDKGDLLLPSEKRFVVELKNVVKLNLSGWLAEAKAEAANKGEGVEGVVVFKRKGTAKPEEQYVLCELGTFLRLVND